MSEYAFDPAELLKLEERLARQLYPDQYLPDWYSEMLLRKLVKDEIVVGVMVEYLEDISRNRGDDFVSSSLFEAMYHEIDPALHELESTIHQPWLEDQLLEQTHQLIAELGETYEGTELSPLSQIIGIRDEVSFHRSNDPYQLYAGYGVGTYRGQMLAYLNASREHLRGVSMKEAMLKVGMPGGLHYILLHKGLDGMVWIDEAITNGNYPPGFLVIGPENLSLNTKDETYRNAIDESHEYYRQVGHQCTRRGDKGPPESMGVCPVAFDIRNFPRLTSPQTTNPSIAEEFRSFLRYEFGEMYEDTKIPLLSLINLMVMHKHTHSNNVDT